MEGRAAVDQIAGDAQDVHALGGGVVILPAHGGAGHQRAAHVAGEGGGGVVARLGLGGHVAQEAVEPFPQERPPGHPARGVLLRGGAAARGLLGWQAVLRPPGGVCPERLRMIVIQPQVGIGGLVINLKGAYCRERREVRRGGPGAHPVVLDDARMVHTVADEPAPGVFHGLALLIHHGGIGEVPQVHAVPLQANHGPQVLLLTHAAKGVRQGKIHGNLALVIGDIPQGRHAHHVEARLPHGPQVLGHLAQAVSRGRHRHLLRVIGRVIALPQGDLRPSVMVEYALPNGIRHR